MCDNYFFILVNYTRASKIKLKIHVLFCIYTYLLNNVHNLGGNFLQKLVILSIY